MPILARLFRLVLGLAALATGPPAHATTFTTLVGFNSASGYAPYGGLVFDKTGAALYGTTSSGGPSNGGTVFKFDSATKTLTTLHAFTNGTDGGIRVPGWCSMRQAHSTARPLLAARMESARCSSLIPPPRH